MYLLTNLSTETVKGIWVVIAGIVGAVLTWIGWSIKAKIDKKQRDAEKESEIEKGQRILKEKLDKLADIEAETARLQDRRMDIITEGLDISLSASEVILEGLHESKIVNGPSEVQRKNIKEFKSKLFHMGLEKPQEDFDPVKALKDFKEEQKSPD